MSSFPFTHGKLASAASLASSATLGKVFEALRISRGSVQLVISGTVAGNILIQASNVSSESRPLQHSTADADWVTVDTTAVSITGSGTVLANFDAFGGRFLRVYFERTSGTGTADVYFCFKA